MMQEVTLYESNNDHLYIQLREGPVWDLGPAGNDMGGTFAAYAADCATGEWHPLAWSRVRRTTTDGLTAVAVWNPEAPSGVVLLAKPEDIGTAQRHFIGHDILAAWTEAHSDSA